MTTKDVLKLLLIAIGYDRKIEIDYHRTDDGSYYYEVYGENADGDDFHFDGYGVLDCINSFLSEMQEYPELIEKPMFGNTAMMLYSTKDVLNDEFREKVYKARKEQDEKTKKYCEETRYITEWAEANHPCPNCPDNKKDPWDDIHYNCVEHHTMRGQKFVEFNEAVSQMYREHRDKNKEE